MVRQIIVAVLALLELLHVVENPVYSSLELDPLIIQEWSLLLYPVAKELVLLSSDSLSKASFSSYDYALQQL